MRTDSNRVAPDALAWARAYIETKYGKDYLPEKPNFFKSKKGAQDAHEAIRPTYPDYPPDLVKKHLSKDQAKLYQLIWNRFIASQMTPALFDQTKVSIVAGDYLLHATGSTLKFAGFTAVYMEGTDGDEAEGDGTEKIPPLKEGDKLKASAITPKQHFTQPPARYSEATLVKELEENGIGRPSTYAATLSTIVDREYAELTEKRFHPTELGFVVTDLLVENFPELFNVEFTAHMEEELDEIAEGKTEWTGAMDKFYGPFKKNTRKSQDRDEKFKGRGDSDRYKV